MFFQMVTRSFLKSVILSINPVLLPYPCEASCGCYYGYQQSELANVDDVGLGLGVFVLPLPKLLLLPPNLLLCPPPTTTPTQNPQMSLTALTTVTTFATKMHSESEESEEFCEFSASRPLKIAINVIHKDSMSEFCEQRRRLGESASICSCGFCSFTQHISLPPSPPPFFYRHCRRIAATSTGLPLANPTAFSTDA